jgi:hypothetical protein
MTPYLGDDPNPPMRLSEVLASMDLPPRRDLSRVEAGRDEEGNLTLMCECGCGTLTMVTLSGSLEWLPGDLAVTCASCLTTYWLPVVS